MFTWLRYVLNFQHYRTSNYSCRAMAKLSKVENIAKRLPEFWQKSGVRPDLCVTATNIRKWIVTTCHQKKCNGASFDERVIRHAMCHSDRAAKANYVREDLTEVSAAHHSCMYFHSNIRAESCRQRPHQSFISGGRVQ